MRPRGGQSRIQTPMGNLTLLTRWTWRWGMHSQRSFAALGNIVAPDLPDEIIEEMESRGLQVLPKLPKGRKPKDRIRWRSIYLGFLEIRWEGK